MTTRDPMHTTVCDGCFRGTWYETEGQACRFSVGDYCTCCGNRKGEKPCPGHLRLIDRSSLAPQFAGYYESGQRIRVRFGYGEEKTGTVGKTTGWRPSYLLKARVDSTGSSDLLDASAVVVARKVGGKYRSVLA